MRLRFTLITAMVAFAFVLTACAGDTEIVEVIKEVVVEKEVTKIVEVEVPGQTVIKEVVKTVEVPGQTVIKEVTKVVEVEVIVDRLVTKVVEVPVTVIVEKEVIKIVEVEKVFAKFGEAPQLAQAVLGGNLPPVEQRLPLQPMVIQTFGETGRYGGTLRRFYLGPADGCNFFRLSRASMVRFSSDGLSFIPSVARGWEVSTDGKQWTFFLREGMKWSDGDSFNADDIMFQYEEVILNEELTSGVPPFLQSLLEQATVEKIDDVTVKFVFPNPNFIFLEIIAQADQACYGASRNVPWTPSHYMKQFHIKFNPNANEDAEAAGFGDWTQLYDDKAAYNLNPDKPALSPWHFTNPLGSPIVRATRNDYFWAVDPEGNQLPYIDNLSMILVDNPEIGTLKAIQGEIDMQGRHIQLPDFPVLKEGEEKGGYHLLTWGADGGADVSLFLNQALPDSAIGTAMRTEVFRQALSSAIDRDSINSISFLGLGIPRQNVPNPAHQHYPGLAIEQTRVAYEPVVAAAMLDSVFPEKDDEGFRTIDGDRIVVNVGVTPAFGPWPDVAEQVARNWEAVGVKTDVQIMTRSLLGTRGSANELAVYVWNEDTSHFTFSNLAKRTIKTNNPYQNSAWGVYVQTDGAEGFKPSQEAMDFLAMHVLGPTLPTEERNALARAIYTQIVEKQYNIGLVGLSPMVQGVIVVNNRVQNVPDKAGNDWPLRTPNTGFPEQWWFSAAE